MLPLSAAATIAEADIADAVAETPAVEGDGKPLGGVSASNVSPELLNLMREVVGQQKELGEERSALMQVWYDTAAAPFLTVWERLLNPTTLTICKKKRH